MENCIADQAKGCCEKTVFFFHSTSDAIENGFRPCGHCMKIEWGEWKRTNLKI